MLVSYFCTQHLYYGQLYFGHYFAMVHPFRLNFLPQIECYMGSCLRYFLIKNILFKNKKCMLTFYGNISYIWYFKVLDSMPVFRVQVYENSSEMTYSCYQTIPHHILHLLDHKKVKFVHGPKMALMRPRPFQQLKHLSMKFAEKHILNLILSKIKH